MVVTPGAAPAFHARLGFEAVVRPNSFTLVSRTEEAHMDLKIIGAWNFPTRVITGPGRISELPEACRTYGLGRPLLVTDHGLAKTDLIADIVSRVREAGIPLSVFFDVKTNPTESNLRAGVAAFKAGGHDGVIAVG